jgi:hypothetical protein
MRKMISFLYHSNLCTLTDQNPKYGSKYYPILQGYNLNSSSRSTSFNTWYTLKSNGVPTTRWVEVLNSQVGNNVFSAPVPSGGPTIPISSWEENIVCNDNGGCTTTFSQGDGTLTFYQNNIVVSGPATYTGENSNCQYSSVAVYTGYAYQTVAC